MGDQVEELKETRRTPKLHSLMRMLTFLVSFMQTLGWIMSHLGFRGAGVYFIHRSLLGSAKLYPTIDSSVWGPEELFCSLIAHLWAVQNIIQP